MTAPARLCIVRHGETDWNAAGILQGSIDTHLNATGLRQAYEIAQMAAPVGFSRIYSSPLLRARVTARIVADVLGMPAPRLHPGIRERYFGAIQGVPKAELAELNPLLCQQILRRNPLADFPEGEPLDAFVARILDALAEIGAENPGARVLVVTHGWVMDVITRHVRHLPPSAILNMKRRNGDSLWLESDGQRIALLSDHAFEAAHPDYVAPPAPELSP